MELFTVDLVKLIIIMKNCVMFFFKFDLPCALAREDLIYSQIGSTIMGRWRRALLDKDK